jgi:BolA family transcriptional regulator, general stress-responsive regulator
MKNKIALVLKTKLQASHVEVSDQSRFHAGHEEAKKTGGGHFSVLAVSEKFASKSRIERHKMVYDAVFAEFPKEVHALAVKAYTPDEWITLNKKE